MEKANIVTPMPHDFVSIESNLYRLALTMAARPFDTIRQACEILVQAYDPCFLSSVH